MVKNRQEEKVTFVCFFWKKENQKLFKKYNPNHVLALYKMVKRHYTKDFDFVCITNTDEVMDSCITLIKMPREVDAWNRGQYRKVFLYSKELANQVKGNTIICLDLDLIICRKIDHLFNLNNPTAALGRFNRMCSRFSKYLIHPHLFIPGKSVLTMVNVFHSNRRKFLFNTSIVIKKKNSLLELFDNFNYEIESNMKYDPQVIGTDQVYFSLNIKSSEKITVLGPKYGIYYSRDLKNGIPNNACIITSPGRFNIWNLSNERLKKQIIQNYIDCGIDINTLMQNE